MTTSNFDEPFYITPVYDVLLRDLYRLYKASAAQLCRLHYSEHTVKLVKKRLRKLADHGYVQFDARPTAQYRSPYYYVLGNKGVEYIKSIGFVVNSSYRPGKEIGQSYLHLLHHLDVNDVLISACNLQRQVPRYTLELFMVERELAHEPFNTRRNGESYGTVPDLFLDFRELLPDGRQRRTPILIEQDRGTEAEEIIRRKAHAYSAMIASGWYKTRYGVNNSITIGFITFEGEKRRDKLRQWVEKEVSKSIGLRFFFTTQPQPPDPKHIWLDPCWWPCVDDKPVAILGEG
jgi:Replication-relaxation